MESENFEKSDVRIDNDPDKKVDVSKIKDNIKKNPWMISTAVLAVIVLILLVMVFKGGITGGVIGVQSSISAEEAGERVLEFANAQGAEAELGEVTDDGIFYKVILTIQGQPLPVYVTKDGESFTTNLIPLTGDIAAPADNAQQPSAEVPKTDKPKVELFIWSYCPYGVQAQGPLAEVASLLGDSADFEAVMYYDGHGPYETQQNKIQACIQDLSYSNYWDYAAGFVDTIYTKCSGDITCNEDESVKLMDSLGIDSSKVMACVEDKGAELLTEASNRAKEYGVTGSPSLIVNGVRVDSGRTADAYKTAVCGAFNNAPSDCLTELDTSAAAAAGSC